ncbi:MAG: NAD(P)-binding domain-containing protein, partial [Myxococcota bacterium]
MSPPALDRNRVAVLGAGRLGRAVVSLLKGAHISVYDRRPSALEELAGSTDHPRLSTTTDISEAMQGASLLYLAVPASSLAELCTDLAPHGLPDQMVLLASRGVTEGFQLPHQHVRNKTCLRQIGVFGGPLHVRELSAGRRLNAVIASRFHLVVEKVREVSAGAPVHFQVSRDVIGVQVAGAVGNVASIAAGMAEALELGD